MRDREWRDLVPYDIYPARRITTVSLAANTHCMMDGHSSCSSCTFASCTLGSNLAVSVNRAIDDRTAHTAGGHLLSVVQAATNTERLVSEPSISR